MALSLTIADNLNGGGATAAVAGADSGTTTTVYAASVADLQLGIVPPYWRQWGTVVGNGQVALNVPNGFYWGYASGTVGGLAVQTPPVYFQASAASLSVQSRIENAVQAKIQGLALKSVVPGKSDLVSRRVYVRMIPSNQAEMYPCIFVTLEGEAEAVTVGRTNVCDEVDYPVKVFLADKCDKNDDKPMPNYLKWREQIMSAFRGQRLAGVPEVITCKPQPRAIFDPRLPQYQWVVSAFTLRFTTWLGRG